MQKNSQTLQIEAGGQDAAAIGQQKDGGSRNESTAPLSHAAISSLALLEDAASVSQSMFGNFLPSLSNASDDTQQLLIVRANETLELYQVNQKKSSMRLVCKYSTRGTYKLSKVIKVPRYTYSTSTSSSTVGKAKLSVTSKDMIVAQLSPLRFVTLEIDEELHEFTIVCMHNFQGDLRLQESGLLHPREGFLQSFCAKADGVKPPDLSHSKRSDDDAHLHYEEYLTGFVFLADHCKLVIVQFKMGQAGLEQASGNTGLSAEYLDVYVPRRQSLRAGCSIQQSPDMLLYPTQIIDLNRQQAIPNPLNLYMRYQKDGSFSYDAFGNKVRDGPTMIDGEQHLDNLVADMDALLQQHLQNVSTQSAMQAPPRTLSEAEAYVRQGQSQHPELRLVSIRDLRVCASASPTATTVNSAAASDRSQQAPRVSLSLLVLHQVHLDKCAGTDSKVPSFNVNIYDVSVMRSQYFLGSHPKVPRQLTKDASCVISLRESIQRLNYYTKSIIANESHDFGQASCSSALSEVWRNDLIYFVSNISIYAYRQERNKLTEVQTSSLCNIVENLVANERKEDKRMPPPEQQAFPYLDQSNSVLMKPPCRVQNIINLSDMELRYDGCTRFHALPNNRLLVISENKCGPNLKPFKYVFHFRFDQGDLDVAAVECVKIEDSVPPILTEPQPYLVPSCLALQVLIDDKERANLDDTLHNNRNSLSFLLSVSSYCHDQQVMLLRPHFDSDETAGAPPEKRQRLMSSDSGLGQGTRRQLKNPVPQSYSLQGRSCLTTLAPITNILQLPTDCESVDSTSSDILISCGPKENSQLRLLHSPFQHALALHDRQKLLDMDGLVEVFTLFYPSTESVAQATQFVILSITDGASNADEGLGCTRVLEFGDRLAEIEYHADDSEGFRVCQQGIHQGKGRTTSITQVQHFIVQVVAYRSLRVLKFNRTDSGANRFQKLFDCELDGASLIETHGDPIVPVLAEGKIFMLQLSDDKNQIKLEALDLPEKIIDCSSPSAGLFVALTASNKLMVLKRDQPGIKGDVICKKIGLSFSIQLYSNIGVHVQPALITGNILQKGCASVTSYSTDFAIGLSTEDETEEERKYQASVVNRIDRFSANKLKLDIVQVKAKVFENAPDDLWLFVMMSFGRLAVYKAVQGTAGLAFKLYSCPVLDKLQNWNIDYKKPKNKVNIIHDDGQQLFILNRKMDQVAHLRTSCLVVTASAGVSGTGSGKLLFNTLSEQDDHGRRISQAKLAKIVKGIAKSDQLPSVFLAVDLNAEGKAALVRVHRPPNQLMDLRSTQIGAACCNGVTVKTFAAPQLHSDDPATRGIKSFCMHRGKFLVVASFSTAQTKNTPHDHVIRQGFNPNAGNMAQDYRYQLEVFPLPSMYHKGRTKSMKKNWKELLNLQKAITTFGQFADDEVVTSLESIELDVQGANEYNATRKAKRMAMQQQMGVTADGSGTRDIATKDDFLLVSTIKLEQKLEKVHYPSAFYILQMVDVTDESGNVINSQLVLLRKIDQQKRLINCLRPFRGHLISVQNIKQDYQIVLQQLRIKPLGEDEAPYAITGVTPSPDQQFDIQTIAVHEQYPILGIKYHLDSAQPFPQSIQSMARFISIEQDEFILIGDVYKSFQVFNPKTAVELEIDDKTRISLKKRFQCKMDASCVAVYICDVLPPKKRSAADIAAESHLALQRNQSQVEVQVDASYDLKDCSFLAASQDGSMRMYKVRDQKTMECVAQSNILDNILSMHPYVYNQRTEDGSQLIKRKGFLVVPRRGSLVEVRQVTFMHWLKIKQVAEVLSQLAPYPFGVPPALAMPGLSASSDQVAQLTLKEADTSFQVASKHLGSAPSNCLLMCSRSLRAQAEVAERFEQGSRLPQDQSERLKTHGATSSAFLTENNFVDVRLVKSQLLALDYGTQRFIAHECGFKCLQHLWQLLEETN